ncbi:hypothetical protein [Streptomyces barkulensis]|nr:hypothetical protein [Streptomyces barkulensis]
MSMFRPTYPPPDTYTAPATPAAPSPAVAGAVCAVVLRSLLNNQHRR